MAFHSPKPKLTPKEMMLWQLKNVIEDINNGGYLLQVKWITPKNRESKSVWDKPKKENKKVPVCPK